MKKLKRKFLHPLKRQDLTVLKPKLLCHQSIFLPGGYGSHGLPGGFLGYIRRIKTYCIYRQSTDMEPDSAVVH